MSTTNRLNKNETKYTMRPFIIFDELENLEYFIDAEKALFVPMLYIGGRRLNTNARQLHAMTFDLDGVTPKHLKTIIYLIEQNLIPRPTFISNSGNGLHLYYVFKSQIYVNSKKLRELTLFKRALTDII